MRRCLEAPRPRWRSWSPILFVGALLLAGCEPALELFRGPPEERARDRFASTPCDTPAFEAMAAEFAASEDIRVAASDESLPESTVHDCQRLVFQGELGPRVGLLVSTSAVETGPFVDGVVVADVVNYDADAFPHLDIQPGINCLWIQETRQTPTGWVAAMRQPAQGQDCATTSFDTNPQNTLHITARTFSAAYEGPDQYPSTGRWMWANDVGQFIGIRCGMAWCEISAGAPRPGTPYLERDSIPGWFDEQYLSYMDGTQIELSPVLGRIIPGADLDQIDDPLAPGNTLQGHAATIILTGADPRTRAAYQKKLALNPNVDRHEVEYLGTAGAAPQAKAPGGIWTDLWKSAHKHAGSGAVRWAWSDDDEGLWFSCDEGCCKGSEMRM